MEYNICYNMDKSCKIILNKHQTYGSQEQAQQAYAFMCGKTTL